MSHRNKTNSYTEFYYHFFRNILIVALPLLVISAIVLSSIHSSATGSGSGSGTDSLTISISSACTLSSVVNTEHNTSTNVGTYTSDIGKTTITTLCNDGNGYSVYANGYSNNEEGNNKLINSSYPQYSIDTGLNTSGLTSQWAMKLNNIPDDPSPTPPTIESAYNNTYGIVPSYWTKVASRASGTTDMAEGSSFTTTYAVYAGSSQFAGTYQGRVKYLLTHSSYKPTTFFMQDVANWGSEQIPNAGDTIQAVDQRDYKKYYVTRLADGHIWMTQNLDLDLDPAKPLTSNDTDLTDHSLTGAYADDYNYDVNTGVIIWTPERKTIDFRNTTVKGWANDANNPYSANKADSTETGHASLGNYYNWTAAIASNNSSLLTQSTLNNMANNPKNSICPKGWRLPTVSNQSEGVSGSTNEFARLNYLYNNNSTVNTAGLLSSPLYFVETGRIQNAELRLFENWGYAWSSTIQSSDSAARLAFSTQERIVITGYDNFYDTSKSIGRPIRCIAK